jgi:SAM-dependent methyltransferase
MSRILIYSPFGGFIIHSVLEFVVARSLVLRGAEVKFVGCDSFFSACEIKRLPHLDAAAAENTCTGCRTTTANNANLFGFPPEWLSSYGPSPAENASIDAWANGLAPGEFMEAVFQGFPVGRWTKSPLHSILRVGSIDLASPEVVALYRELLRSAAVALASFKRLLDSYQPSAVLLLNGRYTTHRPLLELAKAQGIPAYVHERGFDANSYTLRRDEVAQSYLDYLETWEAWRDVPLNTEELDETFQLFMRRARGEYLGLRAYEFDSNTLQGIRASLALPPGRPVIALFNSSSDEVAESAEWTSSINQLDWMVRTVKFFHGRQDLILVLRLHPNTNAEFLLGIRQALENNLSENIRVVAPQDSLSSYLLADLADASLTYQSTIGLEIAMRNRPVLAAGKGMFCRPEYARLLEPGEVYEDVLARFLEAPRIAPEQVVAAYRLAYHFFIRMSIPFPLIKFTDFNGIQLNFPLDDPNCLQPGKDQALDRICGALLHGDPVCPAPNAPGRVPGHAESEARFIRRYAVDGKPYVMPAPPGTAPAPEDLSAWKQEFRLSYQVDALASAVTTVGLRGKRVLEIGGCLPEELVLGRLGAYQWIGVEDLSYYREELQYQDEAELSSNRNLAHIRTAIKIDHLKQAAQLGEYGCIDGGVEALPDCLHGQFDAVFSVAAFEHLLHFPASLRRMYDCLAPGGRLYAFFAPVWQDRCGHHMPKLVDPKGVVFEFGESTIPDWGHLLMSPAEMYVHLLTKTDPETADKVVYFIYHSTYVNRLFFEDYYRYFSNSPFQVEILHPIHGVQPDPGTLSALKARHPNVADFSIAGVHVVLRKAS